jgi:aryl-alcohol dehydrogenase-like predicted oxidoreductase
MPTPLASRFPPRTSRLCLGTADYGSAISETEAFALLDHFAAAGGTFLDTAHIYGAWDTKGANGGYGNSEVILGRWMKQRGCRDQMVVATKGGHPDFSTKASCMTAEGIAQHLNESLQRLQTNRIDVYWFHRDDPQIPVAEILSWLKEPVQRGIIGAVGCSHWRTERITAALEAAAQEQVPLIAASQIAWSLAQKPQAISAGPYGEQLAMNTATKEFHIREQLAMVCYNAQAGGFFAEKYDGLDFSAADFPKPGLARTYGSPGNLARRRLACEIAQAKGCSTNQIALAWLMHHPFPVFPLVGPKTIAQLDDALAACTITLSDAESNALDGAGSRDIT